MPRGQTILRGTEKKEEDDALLQKPFFLFSHRAWSSGFPSVPQWNPTFTTTQKIIQHQSVGRLSEDGLREWMPFVIFHARSHKRLQRHFWANSEQALLHAVYNWKLNLELRSSTNCSCSYKNYLGNGMEGGKKVSLHCFLADQKIVSLWKKCILWHPIAWATGYGPPKMPLKLAV